MLARLRVQLLSQHRRNPLRWHLAALLAVKFTLLYLIWLAWFSQPASLNPQQVAADLLSNPVSTCSRKDACDATQP